MRSAIRIFLWALSLVCCFGCSKDHTVMRIGVDPNWYPIDFDAQQPFVNGFIEDLFHELASHSGMRLERIEANWDSLLDGMREKRYDAVLTSIPPYNFNLAKYDLSKNILDLGPVLVLPGGSSAHTLDDLSHEIVGVLAGGDAALVLQRHADILMRSYPSITALLDALVDGDIKGALLDRLVALSYTRDLYSGALKVVGVPLTGKGLHLAVLKGQQRHTLDLFEESLEHLQKKKKLQELLVKWQLD